jgi:hypothetical protein
MQVQQNRPHGDHLGHDDQGIGSGCGPRSLRDVPHGDRDAPRWGRACQGSWSRSFVTSCAAAGWPLDSRGSTVRRVAMIGWSPSRARTAGSVRVVAAGGWRSGPPTWSTTSFLMSRSGSGSSICRIACAIAWRGTTTCAALSSPSPCVRCWDGCAVARAWTTWRDGRGAGRGHRAAVRWGPQSQRPYSRARLGWRLREGPGGCPGTPAGLNNVIIRFFGADTLGAKGLIAKALAIPSAPNANAKARARLQSLGTGVEKRKR